MFDTASELVHTLMPQTIKSQKENHRYLLLIKTPMVQPFEIFPDTEDLRRSMIFHHIFTIETAFV